MNHFDVVARAAFANPIATRHAIIHFRGDTLKNILHVRPRSRGTAGHDARAMARAFFAAAHAGANEEQSLALDVFHSASGVFEQ